MNEFRQGATVAALRVAQDVLSNLVAQSGENYVSASKVNEFKAYLHECENKVFEDRQDA